MERDYEVKNQEDSRTRNIGIHVSKERCADHILYLEKYFPSKFMFIFKS